MTGKTHRLGGMLCAIVGFLLIKWNGLLLADVFPFLQFIVIYPFAMWGSTASDLDHHWESCPDKNVPNYIINKLLHITTPTYRRLESTLSSKQKKSSTLYKVTKVFSANHRSWQTHSDLTFISSLLILHLTLNNNFIVFRLNEKELAIMSLIMTGVCLGLMAHFILDMLTTDGVWLLTCVIINAIFKTKLPEKIRFVPKSTRFRTGGAWENFIRAFIRKATVVATIILIIELIYPHGLRVIYSSVTSVLSNVFDSFIMWVKSYQITFN